MEDAVDVKVILETDLLVLRDLLRRRDWICAYRATAEFFDR